MVEGLRISVFLFILSIKTEFDQLMSLTYYRIFQEGETYIYCKDSS